MKNKKRQITTTIDVKLLKYLTNKAFDEKKNLNTMLEELILNDMEKCNAG